MGDANNRNAEMEKMKALSLQTYVNLIRKRNCSGIVNSLVPKQGMPLQLLQQPLYTGAAALIRLH